MYSNAGLAKHASELKKVLGFGAWTQEGAGLQGLTVTVTVQRSYFFLRSRLCPSCLKFQC